MSPQYNALSTLRAQVTQGLVLSLNFLKYCMLVLIRSDTVALS